MKALDITAWDVWKHESHDIKWRKKSGLIPAMFYGVSYIAFSVLSLILYSTSYDTTHFIFSLGSFGNRQHVAIKALTGTFEISKISIT
mgnify:CR=1 FL=1